MNLGFTERGPDSWMVNLIFTYDEISQLLEEYRTRPRLFMKPGETIEKTGEKPRRIGIDISLDETWCVDKLGNIFEPIRGDYRDLSSSTGLGVYLECIDGGETCEPIDRIRAFIAEEDE